MGQYTNFSISHEHGAKLRELAKHLNKSASSLLTEWIDRACRENGLGAIEDGAKLLWRDSTQTYIVALFNEAYWIELTPERVKDLARALYGAADRGESILHTNAEAPFFVWRRGTGIRLDIPAALARVPGQLAREEIKLEKSMSADVARKIAADLLAGLPELEAA